MTVVASGSTSGKEQACISYCSTAATKSFKSEVNILCMEVINKATGCFATASKQKEYKYIAQNNL